ncbi:hypothetical protein [uncultured Stenotrophomonas sp.]|uniref:hypothetical protein n=1 Tax=uncultured Stenotrophomonas sp. TaxID=165438 RepID=UPI0025E99598|nr:hypothetical protein [uncultured Stenotrophomonas sp.]
MDNQRRNDRLGQQRRARAIMGTIRALMPLLIALALSACAFLPTKTSSKFYVADADSGPDGCSTVDYRELALACHRISEGNRTVVGIREYSRSGLDSDRFRKVTFSLPAVLRVGDTIDLSSTDVKAFYSTGLSFMPGKVGCYGSAISGRISVLRNAGRTLELDVQALFDLKSPLQWKGHCSVRAFNERIKAVRLPAERLRAWEGVPGKGDSIIEESLPPA